MKAVSESSPHKKFLIVPVLVAIILFLVAVYSSARWKVIRIATFTSPLNLYKEKSGANVGYSNESQLTFERRTKCNRRTRTMCYSTTKSLVVTFWEEKSKEKWFSQNILTIFPLDAFEHIVFVYDNSSWHAHPGHAHFIWIHVRGQNRYWYLKRFLSPKVIKPYEYVWIVDNDAQPDFQPLQYQCVMRNLQIELSAPGRLSGALSHALTKRYDDFVNRVGRWTDFVETGPLVVGSSLAWQCIYTFIDPTLASGWGIDLIWCNGIAQQCILPANSRNVCAILDVFGLHHQSPIIQSFPDGVLELSLYSKLYKEWLTKQQVLGPLADDNEWVDICRG